ncbi:hypothetical protein ACVMIL_011706 [Bradyrhizobium barranii subsp. barranii]
MREDTTYAAHQMSFPAVCAGAVWRKAVWNLSRQGSPLGRCLSTVSRSLRASSKPKSQGLKRHPICIIRFGKRIESFQRCWNIACRQICDRISHDTLPTARRNDVKPLRDPPRPHHVVRDTSQECRLGETSQEADATVGCRTSRQPRHTCRIPVPHRVTCRLLIIHVMSRHRPWPVKHRGSPRKDARSHPRGQAPIPLPHPIPLTTASSTRQDRLPSGVARCKRWLLTIV